MKVRDVMTHDVEIARPDDTLRTAAQMMNEYDTGALPVGENDRLVGMVTDRDLAIRGIAKGLDPEKATIREVMTEQVHYCFEDDSVDAASDKMGELQVRRLLVLNRDKRLVGIISLGDVATGADDKDAGEALEQISQPGGEFQKAAGNKPGQGSSTERGAGGSGTGPGGLRKGGF